jgi:hypothetical protein
VVLHKTLQAIHMVVVKVVLVLVCLHQKRLGVNLRSVFVLVGTKALMYSSCAVAVNAVST